MFPFTPTTGQYQKILSTNQNDFYHMTAQVPLKVIGLTYKPKEKKAAIGKKIDSQKKRQRTLKRERERRVSERMSSLIPKNNCDLNQNKKSFNEK